MNGGQTQQNKTQHIEIHKWRFKSENSNNKVDYCFAFYFSLHFIYFSWVVTNACEISLFTCVASMCLCTALIHDFDPHGFVSLALKQQIRLSWTRA